jgi:hypothetical protein
LVANGKKSWGTLDVRLWANTADSFFGTAAGITQITEAALSASLVNRLGQEAAEKSLPILGLRAITAGAGTASGIAVTVGQTIKLRVVQRRPSGVWRRQRQRQRQRQKA